MSDIFIKNRATKTRLYEELLKVIDGSKPMEIEDCMNRLPERFTLEALKVVLSKYYILYDGFSLYMEKILRGLVSEGSLDEMDDSEDRRTDGKSEKKQGEEAEYGCEVTGTRLVPEKIAKLDRTLADKFRSVKNVDAIHKKMNLTVNVFAKEINRDLYEKVEKIREELSDEFSDIEILCNLKVDRRDHPENR